jgi:hypothetical protein
LARSMSAGGVRDDELQTRIPAARFPRFADI